MSQYNKKLSVIIEALKNKKAEYCACLELTKLCDFTDCIVVTEARSTPHLRALIKGMNEDLLKILNYKPLYASDDGTDWGILDAEDIVVHIQLPEIRTYYDIEGLWGRAASLSDRGWCRS